MAKSVKPKRKSKSAKEKQAESERNSRNARSGRPTPGAAFDHLSHIPQLSFARPHAPFGAKWNEEREAVFLAVLAEGMSVNTAAKRAGVSYGTVIKHRQQDPEFAAKWEEAYEEGTDVYEDEAKRRAIEGVAKPDYYQGDVVGYTTQYSDGLLMAALAARRPSKWKKGSDVNVNLSEPVTGIKRKIITPDGEDITDKIEDAEVIADGAGATDP